MEHEEIQALTRKVEDEYGIITTLKSELGKTIIGQHDLVDRVLISFLCGGHILIEGLPGLAKTLTIRAFVRSIKTGFSRIQFTPDLLPADLVGTSIYNPRDMEFFVKKGPLFTNILLADEINRAPAKVQSALLQAMEERRVTIGDETFNLEEPFMVLATENPIEQEGTYPLPEAQVDRFFMKVLVDYPAIDEEKEILKNHGGLTPESVQPVIDAAELKKKSELIESIYVDDNLYDYIVRVVAATRSRDEGDLSRYIEYGASPRASIALLRASRAMAFINGRGYVTPDDIKQIGGDVLRHRLILTFDADAEGVKEDDVVDMLFSRVEVP